MKKGWIFLVPVLAASLTGCSRYDSTHDAGTASRAANDQPRAEEPRKPDNTGVNERDRGDATLTAGDQSEAPADRELTQKVRQAIVADDNLSMTAQNVKVITANGVVTLRGPVKTEQEKTMIAGKARNIAGVTRVDNQLEVIPQ